MFRKANKPHLSYMLTMMRYHGKDIMMQFTHFKQITP